MGLEAGRAILHESFPEFGRGAAGISKVQLAFILASSDADGGGGGNGVPAKLVGAKLASRSATLALGVILGGGSGTVDRRTRSRRRSFCVAASIGLGLDCNVPEA